MNGMVFRLFLDTPVTGEIHYFESQLALIVKFSLAN